MHILFLTQILPYPLDAGPKVKTWHVLQYLLEKGHQITLATFLRVEEQPYIDIVKQQIPDIKIVPIRRSMLKNGMYWLLSNLTGRPYLIERDDLQEMHKVIEEVVSSTKVDVIHADQLTMSQYALPYLNNKNQANLTTVFDAHNAVWTIVERMVENAPLPLKLLAKLEAKRVKRYEGQIVNQFDHTLAVTHQDQLALTEAAQTYSRVPGDNSPEILVVPIAVDTHSMTPVDRDPGSLTILTLGTLHYPPNADGIRWFLKEVFPLVKIQIPDSKLIIVGKNPPEDFLRAQEDQPQSITVTGYVPDLTPYLQASALVTVPVRAGGGMRVRILEAFARGTPVVTTTIGLEGIEAEIGRDVLVADTAEDLAAEVVHLLRDPSLQVCLAQNARRLAEEKYDWQIVLKKMDTIYSRDN